MDGYSRNAPCAPNLIYVFFTEHTKYNVQVLQCNYVYIICKLQAKLFTILHQYNIKHSSEKSKFWPRCRKAYMSTPRSSNQNTL